MFEKTHNKTCIEIPRVQHSQYKGLQKTKMPIILEEFYDLEFVQLLRWAKSIFPINDLTI